MSTDRIVSVSAIVVSIGTLLMIFYQTSLTRRQQRASVMPSLFIGYSVHEHKESIWISNQGLGPAFIDKVSVIDKEKTHVTDPYGFLSDVQPKKEVTFVNRLFPGRIIPVNDAITIYEKLTDSTSQVILSNTFRFSYEITQMPTDAKDKVVIETIYKDVYGDKWKIRSDQTTPIEME